MTVNNDMIDILKRFIVKPTKDRYELSLTVTSDEYRTIETVLNSKNPDLLPCPFCGGAAKFNKHYGVTFNGSHTADCSCDACEIFIHSGFEKTKELAKKTAIKKWNTRHYGVKE